MFLAEPQPISVCHRIEARKAHRPVEPNIRICRNWSHRIRCLNGPVESENASSRGRSVLRSAPRPPSSTRRSNQRRYPHCQGLRNSGTRPRQRRSSNRRRRAALSHASSQPSDATVSRPRSRRAPAGCLGQVRERQRCDPAGAPAPCLCPGCARTIHVAVTRCPHRTGPHRNFIMGYSATIHGHMEEKWLKVPITLFYR